MADVPPSYGAGIQPQDAEAQLRLANGGSELKRKATEPVNVSHLNDFDVNKRHQLDQGVSSAPYAASYVPATTERPSGSYNTSSGVAGPGPAPYGGAAPAPVPALSGMMGAASYPAALPPGPTYGYAANNNPMNNKNMGNGYPGAGQPYFGDSTAPPGAGGPPPTGGYAAPAPAPSTYSVSGGGGYNTGGYAQSGGGNYGASDYGAPPAAGGAMGNGGASWDDMTPSMMCSCQQPAPLKKCVNGANAGREFYACPKPRDDPTRCRFFKWTDEAGGSAGGGGGGAFNNYGDRTYNMGGGGGGGGVAKSSDVCYKCNQPGHWSKDCPQKQGGGGGGAWNGGGAGGYGGGGGAGGYGGSTPGAGRGGGGGGTGTCFKCGQPGHWASSCPNKGAAGGGAGGGGYGGNPYNGGGGGPGAGYGRGGAGRGGGGGPGGNCYKCGQPGHFSSACPNKG